MEQENDMATNQRKGSTAYQRLAYTNGPLALVYSNVNSKSDWIGTGALSGTGTIQITNITSENGTKVATNSNTKNDNAIN